MKLGITNRQLHKEIQELRKEKEMLLQMIQSNVSDMTMIQNRLDIKEKEFVTDIEKLTEENMQLKQEVIMIDKERNMIRKAYDGSERTIGLLKDKVMTLSKLIVENEKIRSDLCNKLTITSTSLGQKINTQSTIKETFPVKQTYENNNTRNNPFTEEGMNQEYSSHIWEIISDIKSHLTQENRKFINQNPLMNT